GAEKWFNDRVIGDFGLRAGWQWREGMEPNSKFGIGASYAREEFRVNYAYVPAINNLGDAHKVDVSYFFLARPFEKGEKEKLPVVKGAEVAAGDFDLVAARLKNMQFELSTRNFSPGVGSKTRQAEFLLSGGPSAVKDAKWQAEIKDAKGGVVRVIKGAEEFQPALSWDGTDNYGKTVADGDYTVYYFVEYSGKKAWERTRVVSVDTKPPVFSVSASPKVFAPSSRTAGRVEIRVTTQDKDIKSWTAQVKTAKGSVIRRFSGEGINERIIWQADDALGNKVKDGEYETVVTLEDFAGNFSEFSDKVKADSYESRLGVSPKTAAFNPESGGAVFISNSRDSARIKSWDLEIYDSAGKPVRLYSNLSPELKSVSWDGNDAAGKRVSAGRIFTYRAKVEQKNGLVTEESGYLQSLPPVFEGVGIELTLAAIDFAKGSSEIPASEYGYLNQAAEAVKKYAKNYYVIIRGYGADAAGPAEALELSIKRVKEVKKYLSESQGVPEEHIYMTGYGDGSYFERKDAESAQKNPVRVEVELLTK
ncbi:MAG TPA: FlgD immunoglobulin-like domain containing protein, partial [Candidatus Goldiibacteriota bacterium]|nr:FlgD immunoglobulin-like domain containing protein [Candidatus Goldiibacteriota bacterium]